MPSALRPIQVGAPVVLRDVSLRDGLQDEAPIPLADKVAIFEALVAAGVRDLELTSFVRPDRVPAMADADQLSTATAAVTDVRRWALVLNARGAERALAAGLDHLQFVVSVSDAHNRENAGRTVDASFAALEAVRSIAADAVVEVTLATAFGCPHAGPVSVDDLDACVGRSLEIGVDGVGLADTIGTAVPSEVAAGVRAAVSLAGDVPVGAHLHDTRGLAIANALAAVGAGARRLDAAVGGLGGCPFAPGASGNVAIEDLAHALEHEGFSLGLDVDALVDVATLACSLVGRTVQSAVGRSGPRFAAATGG